MQSRLIPLEEKPAKRLEAEIEEESIEKDERDEAPVCEKGKGWVCVCVCVCLENIC